MGKNIHSVVVMCLVAVVLVIAETMPVFATELQVWSCSLALPVLAVRETLPTRTAWQTEPWTRNDKPFRLIVQEVVRLLKTGIKAGDLADKYSPATQKHPNNPDVVFRFAYASYIAAVREQNPRSLAEPINAMDRVLPTQSYLFDRLHFLLECKDDANPTLRAVGLRLLQRDPKDSEVKYQLVKTLNPGWSPEDRRLAIKYTSELIHQSPKSPRVYSLQGYMYDIAYGQSHDLEDGRRAIAAYQHFLKIAPASDNFYQAAASHIHFLQAVMKLQQSHKSG